MKIFNLGLDKSILNKVSALAGRAVEYGSLVEKYTVLVPSPKKEEVELSKKTKAYGSGGSHKLIQFIKIYNQAKKLLREDKYDVITVQDQYYLGWIGVRLSEKFKTGLEIQVHGFEKYAGLRKFIVKYVLSKADAVRCVSQMLKNRLMSEFKVKEEKITVVPIFVDASLFLRLCRESGPIPSEKQNADRFIFLTVSRLVPIKNVGLQIRAMVAVTKKYPQAQLWIVGDGPEKEKLKTLSLRLGIEKNIKLLGWQSQLENFYGQTDVFLLTSNAEGWPLVIIEAASCGLPIIMTDMGSAGEFIKNRENGIVIKVGDSVALEEAMLDLIENEEQRHNLGEKARQAVLNLPSKEETHKLYKISWEKAPKR